MIVYNKWEMVEAKQPLKLTSFFMNALNYSPSTSGPLGSPKINPFFVDIMFDQMSTFLYYSPAASPSIALLLISTIRLKLLYP